MGRFMLPNGLVPSLLVFLGRCDPPVRVISVVIALVAFYQMAHGFMPAAISWAMA